jgi:hypothetical protein
MGVLCLVTWCAVRTTYLLGMLGVSVRKMKALTEDGDSDTD